MLYENLLCPLYLDVIWERASEDDLQRALTHVGEQFQLLAPVREPTQLLLVGRHSQMIKNMKLNVNNIGGLRGKKLNLSTAILDFSLLI